VSGQQEISSDTGLFVELPTIPGKIVWRDKPG